MDALLQVLPEDIRAPLASHPQRANLLEVVLDLGRRPEARFLGARGGEFLRERPISKEDLAHADAALGEFGGDNRAGVEGTLHRISAIRNRRGAVVGLTCRVGRAVTGHIDMIRDILDIPNSILFLGRPGVGKTTVIREMARVLSDELHKRVVIVDTSNEIGGDGDVPHPAIGGARRMQVPDPSQQHKVMVSRRPPAAWPLRRRPATAPARWRPATAPADPPPLLPFSPPPPRRSRRWRTTCLRS
jgi:stage III sporulation protein SpoIIIAA